MTNFNRHPDTYHHWKLEFDGDVAHLRMDVNPDHPFRDGYELKLNSYDLSVDMELADAIQRLRFEHPNVKALVVGSGQERAFCAGANIVMLKSSTHPFKVNFCKFTNETRLSLEDYSQNSGVRSICAINAACAGGGYELALACDEIHLVNDNNSAVSLPEVPLLGVLPGTGGLTRLVDKRKIRRDHADVFCTLAEGLRGKKALKWNFVDAIWPKSKFHDSVGARAAEIANDAKDKGVNKGIELKPISFEKSQEDGQTTMKWEHVTVTLEPGNRVARITITGPIGDQPKDGAGFEAAGCDTWAIKAWREFDDALLQLRFDYEEIGLVVLETRGDRAALVELERTLDQ
ncbi:MAG: enoyl-CoA hydratase-related protein, partial [Planctomycetota bacterium]|nr:enoyl-CoA hydratase-related protein [Planctomycetota bacterium]